MLLLWLFLQVNSSKLVTLVDGRHNSRTERGLGYITRRYAVRRVGTCSVPPTAVLLVQQRGIYTPTSIKVAPVRIVMDDPYLKAYCAIW